MSLEEYRNSEVGALSAAKDGHVDILKSIPVSVWQEDEDLLYDTIMCAVQYSNINILEYMLQFRELLSDAFSDIILDGSVWHNQLGPIRWWLEHGERKRYCDTFEFRLYEKNILRDATWHGCPDIVEYMLEMGVRVNCTRVSKTIGEERRWQVYDILHKYGVQLEECKTGKCGICKVLTMWNEWTMQTNEFSTPIQWMPREMVDDVIELIKVTV